MSAKHTSTCRRQRTTSAAGTRGGTGSEEVAAVDTENKMSDVSYPNLRYSLTRSKPLLYNEAVENIRSMLMQQSELWKRQAQHMDLVIETLEEKEIGTNTIINDTFTESEPLLASRRKSGKRTLAFAEETSDQSDEMGQETIKSLKKRLRGINTWRYERPAQEPEPGEKESNNKNSSGDESVESQGQVKPV